MKDHLYLDNAATSHPKPESVYQAVDIALRQGASAGRGGYQQALSAERLVFETRESLAELFNAGDSERFIFTPNATHAINQALFGLLKPGDRVVTSSLEHNAVTRPLRALQDRGVLVEKVAADPRTGLLEAADVQAACRREPTKLLLINHCSNVFGTIQPIEELGRWCAAQETLFMVDGSQTAGCLPIDFQQCGIDLFSAPGHKGLLGPQGTGFLYVRPGIELTPLIYGGTGGNSHSDLPPEELPERLECGTLNVPGLAGLKAAVEFLLEVGVAAVARHEGELIQRLIKGLANIDGVTVYGHPKLEQRGAAISFNLQGVDPSEVGFVLDQEYGISVRVGLHCAPDAHRTIGTYPVGTVRVSPGYFTQKADIDRFLAAVAELARQQGAGNA